MCLAVPGKIVAVSGEDLARQASVDFGGIRKEINLAYVPEAQIGDYVLVHVGFAISVVDEEEAGKVFGYLKQMDELGELAELTPDGAQSSGARPAGTRSAEVKPSGIEP
jgi:hydrogenase expression/formation protein HypC